MNNRRKPTIGPLDSLQRVRRELGRVYKLARRGELETDQLRAFTHCLKVMAELIEAGDLEKRLDAVEQAMELQIEKASGQQNGARNGHFRAAHIAS